MDTLDLLDEALGLCQRLGIAVRQDWLGGAAGGICELRGRRYVFLDISLSPAEQLERVLAALWSEPRTAQQTMSAALRQALRVRRSA